MFKYIQKGKHFRRGDWHAQNPSSKRKQPTAYRSLGGAGWGWVGVGEPSLYSFL